MQITGNIGLYYTCYRLSRLGWNVMPTSRNARGIDIIAYSTDVHLSFPSCTWERHIGQSWALTPH